MFPSLARASVQQGQGRRGAIQRVQHLLNYGIPVIGLVDRDVAPPTLDPLVEPHVCILPTADLEGAFLSDEAAFQVMLDERYVSRTIATSRASPPSATACTRASATTQLPNWPNRNFAMFSVSNGQVREVMTHLRCYERRAHRLQIRPPQT
jgi:hypothetical protein